ncbi:DUF2812 domain-containing protein [Clostridium sp.]|uniref:DUF2812 domain-containing protein n=1 Tax=Clostridium sp. TaxID=1506 RepID=UPI00283F340C|nr:DUF2812 domain-containing protein [Clostridium sp.]MDR3595781.1 DUF2812 domain-containing protein [Clostridium sp.]
MTFKDTKITFFIYSPYECAAVEKYLEKMAEDGWLLIWIKGAIFKFKKIEPQKIKYSVDILRKDVSIMDSVYEDELLEYQEYCKAAGWTYICQTGKIQVFTSKGDTKIVSIHTDEKEKFKLVFKSSLYNILKEFFITIMLIFNLNLQLSGGSTDFLHSSNLAIFTSSITFLLIFINIIKFLNFFIWAIKAKFKLKENEFMPYNTYTQLKVKNILIQTFSLISVLTILLFILLDNSKEQKSNLQIFIAIIFVCIISFFITKFINRTNYTRNTKISIIISSAFGLIFLLLFLMAGIIFSNIINDDKTDYTYTNINLELKDFNVKNAFAEAPYIEYSKSILAEKTYYSYGKGNYLTYSLLHSKYPWVIKFHENRLLNRLNSYGLNYVQINTSLPNNITVYSSSKKELLY